MTAVISARILVLIETGMTLDAAFDSVLGAGEYAKMVDSVYASLRREA